MSIQTTKTRSWFRNTVITLAIAAIVLTALGSWFTANEFIGITTEFSSYYYGFGSVLVCGFLFFQLEGRRTVLSGLIVLIGTLAAAALIIAAYHYSNETFIFWKMKAVKPSRWNRMISDLQVLDKNGRDANSKIDITHEHDGLLNPTTEKVLLVPPPESLDALGRTNDFIGGHAGIGNDPAVFYGVKSRRWGLLIGSNDFSHGHRASFERIQVGSNAWFFVGTD